MSNCSSLVASFPAELLEQICAAVYYSGQLPTLHSLDPFVIDSQLISTSLPSSYPSASWSEPVARRTLANLSLVNSAWAEAAKPWLWRRIEVRLPQNWMAFVREVTEGEEEVNEQQLDFSIKQATNAMLALNSYGRPVDEEAQKKLQESVLATLSGPDSSIPPELLSPPASREPSPRRLRSQSKSPARWKIMQTISNALRTVVEQDGYGFYVPVPQDVHPGRYVRRIDFSHFRTIGMRRLNGEAVRQRFVTCERLENILKECPNMTSFGATEYMDGALSLSVLKELFLRGSPSRGRGRSSRGRVFNADNTEDSDELDAERRRECKDLVAVDFTGCVSAIFFNALREFVLTYISVEEASSGDETGRDTPSYRSPREPLQFPGIQRLGLLGVKTIQPEILHPFVLAFPSLTHLDLSSTRVSPALLESLGASDTVRLEVLALARCTRLTGDSITEFLVNGRCTRGLKQLNIYGDATYISPLSAENLTRLITCAPCFISGALEYLDLSSAPLNASHLVAFSAQPHLRSLGLSYIPGLPLRAIADFLRTRAPAVEVLTLISTSPELAIPASGKCFNASMALHTMLIQPLCMPPSYLCLGLDPVSDALAAQETPTRLRVLELSMPLLNGLGAGAGTWRIIRSKGGRAWYVDVASGWSTESEQGKCSISSSLENDTDTAGASFDDRGDLTHVRGRRMRRALPKEHPLRVALERLADARGNVSSGMGWHSRKMEVLDGDGMLGQEDGLYGAVAFAYQVTGPLSPPT